MSSELILRAATIDDAGRLLEWRNDPETRRWSFSSDPIAPNEHERWLTATISDPERSLYIGELEGNPIGQARIDRLHAGVGEISVGLDRAFRGRGLGAALIALASDRGARELGLERIVARIKRGNDASIHAFTRAGYLPGSEAPGAVELMWSAPS
jgi:RimJ/RimL family protein N-acetyltransferase